MRIVNTKLRGRMIKMFLTMVLCIPTACSSFKELSLFRSKNSRTEKTIEQSSRMTRLGDYSEIMQWDSSSFSAWIWVDGDFSFHQDSGIKGEKALIQYLGRQSSILQVKDSLISQKDSSIFRQHTEKQTEFHKTKERKTWGTSWLFWTGGILLFLWYCYRSRN